MALLSICNRLLPGLCLLAGGVLAILLSAFEVRADFVTVTPASIPLNPPFFSPALDGALVPMGGIIDQQYLSQGLVFHDRTYLHQTALIAVANSGPLWAPVTPVIVDPPFPPGGPRTRGVIGFAGAVDISFYMPGNRKPAATDFVQITHYQAAVQAGNLRVAQLAARTLSGRDAGSTATYGSPDFSISIGGSNIHSIEFAASGGGGPAGGEFPVWGIKAITFSTPVEIPGGEPLGLSEPATLVLATLGAAGLALLALRRNRRRGISGRPA
ncbi:MAG TPA: hypothetical protein VGG61_11130 [Gemmataceae bacterium]|jgi:hypothetical protein